MIVIGGKLFAVNLLCSAFSFLCEIGNRYPEIKNGGERSDGWDSNPIVATESGRVRGYVMSSSEGNIVYAFEGIPYAQPPIRQLRFQPPVPVNPWENILDALGPPPVCLQVNPSQLFRTMGQEDCLFLNIYSSKIPSLNSSNEPGTGTEAKKLQVMIWIHGGAFSFGYSGDYGPSYLLNHDMVLVTLNYRVGVLGFLSTGDSVCPGNNGLKDQALAIKWVHENIASFGGDVEKITLMGQSAGGVSVHLHMMSQSPSRKYFSAAASLSGNAFVHWGILSKPQAARLTEKMALLQGCPSPTLNSSLTLQCLMEQNPVFLVANQLNLQDWIPFPAILFAPVIEEPVSNSSFLSASPDTLYSEGKVANIPWITSTTSQEGYIILLFLKVLLRMGALRSNWNQLAPLTLNYNYFVTNSPSEVTDRITKFYFKDKSPRDATLDDFSEIISDRYFTFGFEKGLRKHSKVSQTYGYIWQYKGKYNIANNIGIPTSKWGVGHGEDVFYIFNSTSSYPGFTQDDPEYVMSKIIVNVMHNFFETREPLYTTEDGGKERIWTPVSYSSSSVQENETSPEDVLQLPPIEILQLNHDVKMIADTYMKKINFWLSLNLSDTTF